MAAITVTLKSGSASDDPWIIVEANTATELQDLLNSLQDTYTLQTVIRVSKSLAVANQAGKAR